MTIQNPFSKEADPILLVPALSPDIALFHVRWADRAGNVWIGKRKELGIIAHAAKKTFVTCEALHDGNLLEDELLAAGTLPGVYVSGVAPAPRGAWPLAVPGLYPADDAHLAQYARAAASRQGFERYLDEHVWNRAKSSSPVSSPA